MGFMNLKTIIEPIYYDKKQELEDILNNKRNKPISKYIDRIIDIVLYEFSSIDKNDIENYTVATGRKYITFSYQSNVFGKQQRRMMQIVNIPDNKIDFNYYHGKIYKPTSFMNYTNAKITEINANKIPIFIEIIEWIIDKKTMSEKSKKETLEVYEEHAYVIYTAFILYTYML